MFIILEAGELLLLTGIVYNGPPCDGTEIISCDLAEVKYLFSLYSKKYF